MSDRRQDVGILDQAERGRSVGLLLDLVRIGLIHAPIGHCSGKHRNVRRQRRHNRRKHLLRGLDLDGVHAERIGQVHRARYERHIGARRCGGSSDGMALFAR